MASLPPSSPPPPPPSPPPSNFELVSVLHPDLATLDYSQPGVTLSLLAASWGLWTSLYVTLTSLASCSGLYQRLGVKERVMWPLALVHTCFACLASAVGVWALCTLTDMDRDVVFGTTPSSHFTLCVVVGFFLMECSALCVCDVIFSTCSLVDNVHHWLSLVMYSLMLYTGTAHGHGCRTLTLEVTTALSTLCWTLVRAGHTHGPLTTASHALLVRAFHMRSLVECALWYWTYRDWATIWAHMPVPVLVALYARLSLLSLVATPYWAYRKTAEMVRSVRCV